MTHDRVQSDHFILTHEFFAMMLGVRRSSVSIIAEKLKDQNIIEYRRGHVTIIDRAELERRSCECYQVVKKEFDRLLGEPLGRGDVERPSIFSSPLKGRFKDDGLIF